MLCVYSLLRFLVQIEGDLISFSILLSNNQYPVQDKILRALLDTRALHGDYVSHDFADYV